MFEPLPFSQTDFSGRVRLFPLPNLVLFPHVMQPLHVFEPRYQSLLLDALRKDRLITMATLAPGWETDYEGQPPLYPIACLGHVTTYHRLDDGTFNVLLSGLCRVRLVRELSTQRKFREAEGVLLEDVYPSSPVDDGQLKARLRDGFLRIIPLVREAQEQLDQLLAGDIALGVLVDIISYMLNISLAKKEALLAELDVVRRAEMVLAHLEAAAQSSAGPLELDVGTFPPQFSLN